MKRSFLAAAAFLLVLPLSAQQTAKEAEAPAAPDRDKDKVYYELFYELEGFYTRIVTR